MKKLTRHQILKIARCFDRHPQLVNFLKRTPDFTATRENLLWEELASNVYINMGRETSKKLIKAWWEDYFYDLNRAYMNVLTSPEDAKMLELYDKEAACKFLTAMGYENVEQVLSNAAKYMEKRHLERYRYGIASCSTSNKDPNQTLEPSLDLANQPEVILDAPKDSPKLSESPPKITSFPGIKAKSRPEASQNPPKRLKNKKVAPKSSVLKPILPKDFLKSLSIMKTVLPNRSEGVSILKPLAPDSSDELTILLPIASISSIPMPISQTNLESQPTAVLQKSSDKSPSNVDKITKSLPIAQINSKTLSKNQNIENAPTSCISAEDCEMDDFSPNDSTDEVLLMVAKEMNLDSTLAKQKRELEQEELRLGKRKVKAVNVISECYISKTPAKPTTNVTKSLTIAQINSKSLPKKQNTPTSCISSEDSEMDDISPNDHTDEALLKIAKEMGIDSAFAKRKMELEQEELLLRKRKVQAVNVISECCILKSPAKPMSTVTNSLPIAQINSKTLTKKQNAPTSCISSEDSEIDDFSPNDHTDEALLMIAKEMGIESAFVKRKMELEQEELLLRKRKVEAVNVMSEKWCLL